jgi:mannose-6-phosphate isomerase-like protein (cupin superfamily)
MRLTPCVPFLIAMGCNPAKGDARIVPGAAVQATADTVAPDSTTRASTGPGDIDFYPAVQLSRAADAIARGTSTATVLARRPDRYYVEARRVGNGVPEVHDDFSDVTFVQAGRAVLHTGASVRGSHLESAGEHRGGTIDGGSRRTIVTGDFFVIPPGTPHRYEVAAGDSIRYLTVKVRRSP